MSDVGPVGSKTKAREIFHRQINAPESSRMRNLMPGAAHDFPSNWPSLEWERDTMGDLLFQSISSGDPENTRAPYLHGERFSVHDGFPNR